MPIKKVLLLSLLVAILMLVLGIAWLILSTQFKGKSNWSFNYYPSASFEIPEEILQERIATDAAFTARIPIIMYHYIEYVDKEKDPGKFNLATSPYVLERQISVLVAANYNFLFAKDIPEILSQKNPVPPRPVALTFDDGYEDFYFNALPILQKYHAKATIYVMPNFIGRSGYLNLEELKKLRDSGLVEIAAHTLEHAYLKNLKIDLAKKEIRESKTKLESLLGMGVYSFSYPWGAFSKETIQMVKAARYTSAVSVIPGINQSEENNFYLFRIRPGVLGTANPAKMLELYK